MMHHQVSLYTNHTVRVHPSAFLMSPCLVPLLTGRGLLAGLDSVLDFVLCCMEGVEGVLRTSGRRGKVWGKRHQRTSRVTPVKSHNSLYRRTRYRHSTPFPPIKQKYPLLPITPSPNSTINYPASPIPSNRASRTPPPPPPLLQKKETSPPAPQPQPKPNPNPTLENTPSPARTTLEPRHHTQSSHHSPHHKANHPDATSASGVVRVLVRLLYAGEGGEGGEGRGLAPGEGVHM